MKLALSKSAVNTIVKKNAKLTAKELESRSSIIAGASGLKIEPTYYELASDKVKFLQARPFRTSGELAVLML